MRATLAVQAGRRAAAWAATALAGLALASMLGRRRSASSAPPAESRSVALHAAGGATSPATPAAPLVAPPATAAGASPAAAMPADRRDASAAPPGGPATAAPVGPGTDRVPRALWLGIYLVAIVGPFALVATLSEMPRRPFVFELGSGLGISALSVLALQLILPARLGLLAPLGADVAVRLHRRLADALAALIVAHVAAVMLADPARLGLLAFVGAPWRAQAAIGSVIAIVVLMVSSMRRRGVGLSYAGWRGVHVVLGVGALVLAAIHTVGVGRYLAQGVPGVALVALTLVGIGAVIVLRLPHAAGSRLRPYVVRRVVPDPGGATVLELEADGHPGQPFSPGQFAWLKLPGIRSSLAEHPFSYSSSALAPASPAFTIQPYQGFSRDVARFTPGTRVLVDGPHGSFRLRPEAAGCVLVAGGIGITPSMSVLRTAAEQGDARSFVLLYASKTPDRFVFRDELDALRERMALTVVLVASSPPADWPGERGRITHDLLDRALPGDLRAWQFLVCGPPAFVDAAVRALSEVGIPAERVHAERFVTV